MKAVVIGAGRIGCGLVAEMLRASDHEVVFVTRSRILSDHFNRVGGYSLRLLDGTDARDVEVDGVRSVCVTDTDRVVGELAGAELVVTCLRPHSLPRVAPLIADALRCTAGHVNVLTLENSFDAGAVLRAMVASYLPSDWPLDTHGFSGALAARVVSRRLGDPATDEPLTFVADPPAGCVVDRGALRGALPEVEGIVATDHFGAAVRQKLYTFSAGHAVTAYLGFLKGYRYVHTAIRDTEIRAAVTGAMMEGKEGLRSRYGTGVVEVESDPIRILARFDNAALDDSILRVGRDPRRKLGPMDRLVGAAMLAEEAGFSPEQLALAAAAALCFEDPGDPASTGLQVELQRGGVHEVLKRISRLDPSRGFGRNVAGLWARLRAGHGSGSKGGNGNHLLSLERLVWAWAETEAGLSRARPPVAG